MRITGLFATALILAFYSSAQVQQHIQKISPFEVGKYNADGNPIGLWNYYDNPDSLALTINHDNGHVIYRKASPAVNLI